MRHFHILKIVALAMLALSVVPAAASEQPAAKEEPELVLVLSGGGARGAAHVGALRVLEELHIVPDMIIGTSFGSIVGGLYAAGWSPEELHQLLLDINWNEAFKDSVDRNDSSFRRKQDDRPYLVDTRLHFDKKGFRLPSGVVAGQSLEVLLRAIEARTRPAQNFDELPIPYRAVATDIEEGVPVIFDSGSLATAMRASMAIPGMFPPVIHEGRTLVDGGSVANLPVGIAQALGADSVIAIDITSPLTKSDERLTSFLDIFMQVNSLVTVTNRVQDVKRLGPGDVYLRPELGEIGFLSFERVSEAVDIGEEAARAKLDELRRFSASDEEWAAFMARHRKHPAKTVQVDRVRLVNGSLLNDEIALKALGIDAPGEFDADELREDILELYDLRHSGVITFHVDEIDGERELVVESPEPAYGPHSLQFGISFIDDFRGDTGYTFTVRHQYLPSNRRGGEWQNVLQVGSIGVLSSQFYQPLDSGLKWFVSPTLMLRRFEQEIWVEGDPWAEYRMEEGRLSLDGGRVLGNWGELRLGAFYSHNRGESRIGLPLFPTIEENRAGATLRFVLDTENSVAFPRSGGNITVSYRTSIEDLGSDVEFEQFHLAGSHAWSAGEFTFEPYIEYGDNRGDVEGLFELFSLGGLGRLSGLGTNELLGEEIAFARLQVRRRMASRDLAGIRLRFYAGMSLEAGNVYDRGESIDIESLMTSWALYVGAETPLGPLFLGYGNAEGRDRFYLAIGDHF